MSKQKVRLKIFMNNVKRASLIMITFSIMSGTALAAISYSLGTIPNPSIYTGDSTTVSVSITNNNLLYKGYCAISLDSSSWSTEYPVSSGQTITKSISVQAPDWGNGDGSLQYTVYSYCYSTLDSTKIYKSTSFILTYTENPAHTASQAINSAQSAINSAQSSINNAQNALNDAKNIDADTSLAENKLSNSQNSMQTAQTKQSAANAYFTSSNYNQAKNTANEAKSAADSSKNDADNAYSITLQAKQIAQAAKDSASMAITNAKKALDSATTSKTEAQNAINDAKNKGSDIVSAQALLDTVVSKLNSASSKYDEANSYFNNKKWNDAKTTADDAKTYANDALNNAGLAKTSAIQAKPLSPKTSVSIDLHGEKTNVVLGEDILLKLSAVNYISMPEMHVQVIIKPPSGMGVTSSEFSLSGAGQYTANYKLLPGEGKDIEVRIRPNQVGDFDVKGTVIYYFGDEKENYEEKSVNLPITVRNGKSNFQNEISPSQEHISGFGLILAGIGMILAIAVRKK